jgi:hypothetical protein
MSEWQPIETAPKERYKLLLLAFPWCEPCVGYWDDDKYSSKPKPMWRACGLAHLGVKHMRANPPTHWMPLPEPPK